MEPQDAEVGSGLLLDAVGQQAHGVDSRTAWADSVHEDGRSGVDLGAVKVHLSRL